MSTGSSHQPVPSVNSSTCTDRGTYTGPTGFRQDEDVLCCQICHEPFNGRGADQLCCLPCGHLFGHACIQQWLAIAPRCPACNRRAQSAHVRILRATDIRVVDNSQLSRLQYELDLAKAERSAAGTEHAKLCATVTEQAGNITMLRKKISSAGGALPSHSQLPTIEPRVQLGAANGGYRVGACCNLRDLLALSCSTDAQLGRGAPFGVQQYDAVSMRPVLSSGTHLYPIRDMAFSSYSPGLLLTVGLDGKAVLFSCRENRQIGCKSSPQRLWSCAWDKSRGTVFHMGDAAGGVSSFDVRCMAGPVDTLAIPDADRSGVGRIVLLPAGQQSTLLSADHLLVQKIHSVWLVGLGEGGQGSHSYRRLPLDGPFSSVDFDPISGELLVSTRGNAMAGPVHNVCRIQATMMGTPTSCDVLHRLSNSFRSLPLLGRSALFSTPLGAVCVAGNGLAEKTIHICDTLGNGINLDIPAPLASDFVIGRVGMTDYICAVTENGGLVYSILP